MLYLTSRVAAKCLLRVNIKFLLLLLVRNLVRGIHAVLAFDVMQERKMSSASFSPFITTRLKYLMQKGKRKEVESRDGRFARIKIQKLLSLQNSKHKARV